MPGISGRREPVCFALPTGTNKEGNLMNGQTVDFAGRNLAAAVIGVTRAREGLQNFRDGTATPKDKEGVGTSSLTKTAFTRARQSVATTVAAVLLAAGVAAGLLATAPTASAATRGDTHCFASTKHGPHVGCQLDRADSVRFRGSFLAAGAAAAGTVCAVLAESGPVVALCGAAAAGIAYWVSSYAPTLAANQCIEIGAGVDSTAPYKLDAGAGYIKRIACSVE
jgi:hypothetical protein